MRFLCRPLLLAGLIALATPLHAAPNVFWTFGFDFPASATRTGTSADAAVLRSTKALANAARARLAAQAAIAPRQRLAAHAVAVLGSEDVQQTIAMK